MKKRAQKKIKARKVPQVGARKFPTMASAAGAMSIPFPILKRLKAAGCPGFLPSNRVDEALVLAFAEDHPDLLADDGLAAGYDPLKKAQLEKVWFDLEVKKGRYEEIAKVKDSWAKGMEVVMKVMSKLMTREDYNAAIRQIKAEIRALDL